MSDQPGYQPMPAEQPPAIQQGAPLAEQPSTVRNAVYLMYARIVLGALSIVLAFTTKSTIRASIEKSNGANGKTLSPSQIDTAVTAALAFAIVLGLVFLVLYVVLALQLRKGKKWAWIVTLILAALGVLSLLASFAQAGSAVTHTVGVLAGLLDLAILVLLLLTPSRAYFGRRAG